MTDDTHRECPVCRAARIIPLVENRRMPWGYSCGTELAHGRRPVVTVSDACVARVERLRDLARRACKVVEDDYDCILDAERVQPDGGIETVERPAVRAILGDLRVLARDLRAMLAPERIVPRFPSMPARAVLRKGGLWPDSVAVTLSSGPPPKVAIEDDPAVIAEVRKNDDGTLTYVYRQLDREPSRPLPSSAGEDGHER